VAESQHRTKRSKPEIQQSVLIDRSVHKLKQHGQNHRLQPIQALSAEGKLGTTLTVRRHLPELVAPAVANKLLGKFTQKGRGITWS
jgi:hypothetical protein